MRQIQIQDRGIHNYRQQRSKPAKGSSFKSTGPTFESTGRPTEDLQMDLQWICRQSSSQDRSTARSASPDRTWSYTKLSSVSFQFQGATQSSLLVSFQFQTETSTGREKPMMDEETTLHSCHQISVHQREELVSEGGFHQAPGGFHKAPKHVNGELPIKSSARRNLGVHAAIYKSTRIYKNLHRSTRLTTSQDIHPYI